MVLWCHSTCNRNRFFVLRRPSFAVLRLENPFTSRQVDARVYICVAEEAEAWSEEAEVCRADRLPNSRTEVCGALAASLLQALREPDETPELLATAWRLGGALGLQPWQAAPDRTPAVVCARPLEGSPEWGPVSKAMPLEFAVPKRALESAKEIHRQALAAAHMHLQWTEMAELLSAATRRGTAGTLHVQRGVAKCSIAAGRSSADWEHLVREAALEEAATCEAKLEQASLRDAAVLQKAVADARREERAKVRSAIAAARAEDAAERARTARAAAASAVGAEGLVPPEGGFADGWARGLLRRAELAQADAVAKVRAEAASRVLELESQLSNAKEALEAAQTHADLAFQALELGLHIGPRSGRREDDDD